MKKPTMQPIYVDNDGIARFRPNAVIQFLHEVGCIDLNKIPVTTLNKYDVAQFWQMLGYTVSGYGDLSFIPSEIVEKADQIAADLIEDRHRSKK